MDKKPSSGKNKKMLSKPKWFLRSGDVEGGRSKKAFSNRLESESNTSAPSSSACLPSTSGTEKRNSLHSTAKAVICQDASTQMLVTTQNRATQVDKMVACTDKATSMDKRMFHNGIKQGPSADSLTFHLESSLGADIIRHVLEFSSSEGSPCSVLSPLETQTSIKSDTTTTNGRKYTSPDAMSHKRMGCITNTKTPPKRIDPSHQETSSPLPHSPSLPHSSDKQTVVNTLKRKTHLKQLELQHTNNPKKALAQGLELLGMDDWEKTITGLNIINSVVQSHPDILVPRLHDVCHTLILEVMNLRSCVSRVAVSTLGMMYAQLQKKMDAELEVTAAALLQKVGIANEFIRQDVDAALDSMVQNCSVAFVIKALLAGGLRHLNSVVRKCASQHLLNLVEMTDAARLLSDTRGITECILPTAARLAQDASQEVSLFSFRHFGRQVLVFMAPHPDFDKMLRKYIPAKDIPEIRDIVKRAQEFAKTRTNSPTSDHKSSLPGINQAAAKVKQYSMAQKEEYIEAMKVQMASKDFPQRIEAIDKIVADCKEKPDLVVACKYPVFDAIVARLQESNRKINQHALEALQAMIPLLKDSLAQVVKFLVPAIVDNHLNSKIDVIHNAADGALNSLIQHLDNALLLEVLCTKAQLLNGKAKGHLIDKLAGMVTGLYPRQPQIVEQKVLPLLWKLLVSSHNRAPIVSLCQALHVQMGQRVRESAASQSAEVNKALNQLLQTF
ncbi:TOG array regulator of axonemal microtubules protein 1-like isoform X2 [Anguilla anguilla]|uniref:TOG array regulator of axonemal microtubules protein 1-like isoform X2 n=1 Tax=Anguilla anguilla TaxID=7936 RepID=UPI0015AD7915|nr:TOG array regulator of axonemal microtubules protein 1-like isoform X2 [Anguilla anguilla]